MKWSELRAELDRRQAEVMSLRVQLAERTDERDELRRQLQQAWTENAALRGSVRVLEGDDLRWILG